MSKIPKWAIAAAALLAVSGVAYYYGIGNTGGGSSGQGGQRTAAKGKRGDFGNQGPAPVIAATAQSADVPVYLEGLGTVRALNTVTVQPLVDGRLLSVDFTEGQDVKKGDLLARIDPTIYQAQLDQAVANKGQHAAQLENAKRDLDRALKVGTLASSQKTTDTARALVAQLEAQIKADQANIDNMQALLGYTSIIAPIDGRTGIRMVDAGNVVRASANSAVVVLTQVQPIAVLFNLPQQQLGSINKAMAKGGLSADALGPDNRTVIDRGKLTVVDNQVDQTTGTIRLKAEFPNGELQLWPGQFVNVRLQIDTLGKVVVVPTAAVQQGPTGSYVFTVGADEAVKQIPVAITQQNDRQAVIGRGVSVGDVVVTAGFSRLKEGAKVAVSKAAPADETGAAVAAPGDATAAKAWRRPDGAADKTGGARGEGRRRNKDGGPTP